MSEKISGIILNIRKYNDRNSIVTIFTRSRGRLSFISATGSGKGANVRRAKLQPLSVISTELKFKPSAELQRLGSFSSEEIWTDLYFNPYKRLITIFISEFLYRLLNATMPDPDLYDFLVNSFRLLDHSKDNIADFNIPFLVSLLSFSGIQPNIEGYSQGKVFDFSSGSFLFPEEAKGPFINAEESQFVNLITRINFSNIKSLRLTNANRRQILYGLLNYFSFHFPGLASLKSPEILREILD